jgi:hypothetical protein
MKIENVKRDNAKALQGKSVSVSIRITPAVSKWLKANEVSPTALFNEAVNEIGYEITGAAKEE